MTIKPIVLRLYRSNLPVLAALPLLLLAVGVQPSLGEYLWRDVCTQKDTQDLPFCNAALDTDRRVDDLLRRIPVESQIKMMLSSPAAGYEPLYIPPYQWWNEGLHGMLLRECFANPNNDTKDDALACPTSFPCPSTLATSWNDTLFYLVASAIGREGRAISNIRAVHNSSNIGDGITLWTPVVNMQRDPRWGRNQEVPGEDPTLTGRFAVQFVRGLQQVHFEQADADTQPMQVAACCKHWIGNSLEHWQGYSRHSFNAQISTQDLHEYYQPPFEACVQQAGAAGVMCSYNAVNGIPSCVNAELLQGVLRQDWGFTGYITSDCGALGDVDVGHHYTQNRVETAALALNATVNLNCVGKVYKDYLPAALQQGYVTVDTIADQLRPLLTVQMKLGLFNQPKNASIYGDLGFHDIDSPQHQQLALEAAEQSIVLLQNKVMFRKGQTDNRGKSLPLPLSPGQTLAVIGPHVNATTALLGNYRGWRCPSGRDVDCVMTPLAAIRAANKDGTTLSALGCHVDGPGEQIAKAFTVAAVADVIVLLIGLDNGQETEERDRVNTTLPGHQVALVQAILELQNPHTILVFFNGGALSLGDLKDQVPAIVHAGYGGQAASTALARVLFGAYNPSGRLVATMYPPDFVHQMPMNEMGIRVGVGRTHMFYQGQPEFSFGRGLSYSEWTVQYEFSYDGRDHQWALLATLTNQGPYPGRQSLLILAARDKKLLGEDDPKNRKAQQRLIDYGTTQKILEVGAKETLSFDLDVSSFSSDESLLVFEPNDKSRNLGSLIGLLAEFYGETSRKMRRRKVL